MIKHPSTIVAEDIVEPGERPRRATIAATVASPPATSVPDDFADTDQARDESRDEDGPFDAVAHRYRLGG